MKSAPLKSEVPPAGVERRLRLRPEAPERGVVDGAWWPRSSDLVAELPALLAELTARLGEVRRVSYDLEGWNAAPSRLVVEGVTVRLDGFRTRPAHTLDVLAGDRRRLTLLLVPPDTGPSAAGHMMTRASRSGNTDTVEELLRAE